MRRVTVAHQSGRSMVQRLSANKARHLRQARTIFEVLLALMMMAGACGAEDTSAPAEPTNGTDATTSTTDATADKVTTPDTTEGSGTTEAPTTETAGVTSTTGSAVEDTATSSTVTPDSTSSSTTSTSTTLPSQEWTLLAGGDVLMDRTEQQNINPFALLNPQFDTADIALVNVEMAIGDRGRAMQKRFVFRAPSSAAARIALAGIDIVTLGNNHAMDYGGEGLINTIEWLHAAQVATVGAGGNRDEAYEPHVLTTEGNIDVAFVGFSQVIPYGFIAGSATPGIAIVTASDQARALSAVRTAAEQADVVIATVHWGIERDTCQNQSQEAIARALLDAGATAVIGHHPHVLQPVIFQGGKLVAYSLGNFVWHPRANHTGETGVLQIDFDGAEIVGWSFHPHLLDSFGSPAPHSTGTRVDRIRDVIAGDCARHDPPPPAYATTTTTEAPPDPEDSTTSTLPPPTGTAGLEG